MKGEVGQGVRVASRTLDVKAVEVGAGNDDGDVEHVAVAGGWVRRDDGGGYIIRLQKVHWGMPSHHTHTCTYACIYTHACTYTCTYTRIYIHMHIHTHKHMFGCGCTCSATVRETAGSTAGAA